MNEPGALRGAHLHFDCASGAAGDMTLGALIDAGVPVAVIRDALDRLGVGGNRLTAERVLVRGIRAMDVKVRVDDLGQGGDGGHAHGHSDDHDHGHDHGHDHRHDHGHDHGHGHGDAHGHGHDHGHAHHHDHGHGHVHRHYRDIRQMILDADLDPAVVARALDMFERVARAEALLHGTTVDQVAFHEVGAMDSIVDIVGTAAALAWLAPASVSAVSVAMGHGSLRCAHGVLPVPAPAALEILREAGGVMADGGLARELCTPTGAAILAAAVTHWAPMPPLVPVAVGYGAGDAVLPDRANVLRVIIGRPAAGQPDMAPSAPVDIAPDRLWRVEANIDDMSPELCAHAAERAFAAGAVDVWWTPIVMKKGRPALMLAALAPDPALAAVSEAMLRETSTIGVRFDRVSRRVLERRIAHVDTVYGRLPVKIALLDGDVVNIAPEHDPCAAAARDHGVALKQVLAAVVAAQGVLAPDPAGLAPDPGGDVGDADEIDPAAPR